MSASHYRTHAGAEVDLVLEDSSGRAHAIEIKRTLSPKLTPAFRESMTTLGADRGTYLMPGGERFPLSEKVTAINLIDFLKELSERDICTQFITPTENMKVAFDPIKR